MNFIKGRNNLSVTVYVPYDCPNTCVFCDSKKEYTRGADIDKIKQQLIKVKNSSIKEVVFSGGEPMINGDVLSELMDIVQNKDVYVNTSFISNSIERFIPFFNKVACIKGINISRHATSWAHEELNFICPDSYVDFLRKKVKINVVIPEYPEKTFFESVLKRWTSHNVKVSFRANFNTTDSAHLHSFNDPTLKTLLQLGEFVDRKYCDVCDTILMKRGDQYYEYHRGLATTSISLGNTTIVNDIIIFPDGELCYDWDRKTEHVEDMKEQFGFNKVKQKVVHRECSGYSCGNYSCGSGGC